MPFYAQDPQGLQDLTTENSNPESSTSPNSKPQQSDSQTSWQPEEYSPEYYEKENLRWIVEQELRKELCLPSRWAPTQDKIEFHRRQLLLLEKANKAPRCEHVYTDGRCCGAPRVRKGKLCYAHTLMDARRPRRFNLPPLEDANAVMLWLMEVSRGLLEGQISERTAGLMFYGLQLAMVNARWTTFTETKHEEMVRKAPEDRRKPLTTKDIKEHKGEEEGMAKSEDQQTRKLGDQVTGSSSEIAGVESCKSIFSGVEGEEGEAGDRDIGSSGHRVIRRRETRKLFP